MNITNLLHVSYWFSLTTPPFRRFSFIAVLSILALCLVGAIALRVAANQKRKNPPLARGLVRLARPLFFFSILGAVLIWFRELGATVVSARFLLLLIFMIALAWFVLVLKGVLKTYQSEYELLKEKRKYEEYLPRKRK